MSTLWNKHKQQSVHPTVAAYTAGDDLTNDLVFFPYDIAASKAHVEGLHNIGVLGEEEEQALLTGLSELASHHEDGNVTITVEDEDGPTVIENYLTEKFGGVGKKIHTGRSRNDQSLVAARLYMLDQLGHLQSIAVDLAETLLGAVEQYQDVPLPGYTHTQQAMLSSVGHYYCSILESLLDDIELLESVTKQLSKNPLGGAAGFGVSFPLDRTYTTSTLGFEKILVNSLYCQTSRGKYESLYLEALGQIMMTLGTFAADLIFFTSQECNFFAIDPTLATGSSIMPQKKNLDGLEVLRGYVSVVQGNHCSAQSIAKGLLSGYHRDYQLIKKLIIESTQIAMQSVHVATLYVEGATPNREEIEKKISHDIFMADIANALVQEKNIPFRDAYKMAAEQTGATPVDFTSNIASKVSAGAPGNLQINVYRERIHALQVSQNNV